MSEIYNLHYPEDKVQPGCKKNVNAPGINTPEKNLGNYLKITIHSKACKKIQVDPGWYQSGISNPFSLIDSGQTMEGLISPTAGSIFICSTYRSKLLSW